MNSTLPLADVRKRLQSTLQNVLGQRFFHDRLSMFLLAISLIINAFSFGWLLMRIRPTESLVPVHFSSFGLFDELGPWYFPYELALVALLITLVNALFAYHSFTRSRLASFFLMTTSVVVAIFTLVIAQAFGGVR